MDSFQAKIRSKRQRKREKKNNCFFLSNPTRNRKFQKNSKKISKIKKIPLRLHFKKKQVGKGREIEKIEIIIPFRSYPTPN